MELFVSLDFRGKLLELLTSLSIVLILLLKRTY